MNQTAEILMELKALSSHYPRRQMAQADYARWLDDYVGDIAHASFNAADVRLACAQWRQGEHKRMPSPGELIAKCRSMVRNDVPQLAHHWEPPPRVERDPEVPERFRRLIAGICARTVQWNRLSGETPAAQAERLWPSHRVDRLRAAGKLA